jgi:hypothetical protein
MNTLRNHRPREGQKGFVLLMVMVLLIAMLSLGMVVLRETGERIKQGASARAQASVSSALMHGLDQAINELRSRDPVTLSEQNWDIFSNPANPNFVGPLLYPDVPIPGQDQVDVRVGLRIVGRTRPPPGEDVKSNLGYVAEVLLSVRTQPGIIGSGSEERVAVGLQVPHTASHSGN